MPETDNKRIAKNTIYLYFRSFLMMAISIFSSRVILQALGVSDYGLYNAIGSIVAMFAILNGVLATGTSRFLTFELGKNDFPRLKKTFGAAFAMHVGMAAVLFILLETVGLWFVNNKLNIPAGRVFAANVVYQLSILSSMLSLTQVPYSATIIAHEKMGVYAYVGIAEATFKLALIFILLYVPFNDNLIAYAIIMAAWSVGLQIFYRFYCYNRFPESHLSLVKDKNVYKSMLGYSLWDLVGQFCSTGNSQGVNLLINMFFGTAVNAARGVAYQVENALTQFAGNFMTALNPQIVKSYAQDNRERFFQLIYDGGKFAYFLLFLFTLPVILEADYILKLWLVKVPPLTPIFLRSVLAITLIRVTARPLINGVHATGNVKYLNLWSGLYSACTFLPLVYLFYKLGYPSWFCFIVQGFNAFVCTILEVLALYKNVKFNLGNYFFKVYGNILGVSFIASVLPIVVITLIPEGFIRLIITCFTCTASSSLFILYFGFNKEQRIKVLSIIKNKMCMKGKEK